MLSIILHFNNIENVEINKIDIVLKMTIKLEITSTLYKILEKMARKSIRVVCLKCGIILKFKFITRTRAHTKKQTKCTEYLLQLFYSTVLVWGGSFPHNAMEWEGQSILSLNVPTPLLVVCRFDPF